MMNFCLRERERERRREEQDIKRSYAGIMDNGIPVYLFCHNETVINLGRRNLSR